MQMNADKSFVFDLRLSAFIGGHRFGGQLGISNILHQILDTQVQRIRDLFQCDDGRALDSGLHPEQMGAVQGGAFRQPILREAFGFADLHYSLPDYEIEFCAIGVLQSPRLGCMLP